MRLANNGKGPGAAELETSQVGVRPLAQHLSTAGIAETVQLALKSLG